MNEDYMEAFVAKRQRRKRIAIGASAIALVTALFYWGPDFTIDRAGKAFGSCSNVDYEEAPNPSTECSGGKLWLLFPKIVPWKHAAATKASRSLDFRIASRKLAIATKVAPSAAARDAAVARMTEVFDASTPADLTTEGYASTLTIAGAIVAPGSVRKLDMGSAQTNYLSMLEQFGRLDDAIAFAKNPPKLVTEDFGAREVFLRRGALLCLVGDEAEGRAALHDAQRVHGKLLAFPFHEARVALAACGEVLAPGGDDLDRDALLSYDIGTTLVGDALDDRIIGPYETHKTVRDGNEAPFVAGALAEREHGLERTLQIISALTSFPSTNLSPWTWDNAHEDYPVFVDPARDEASAARLEALASTAPTEQSPLGDDEELHLAMPPFARTRYLKLHQKPAAALRDAARGFWLEAAGNRARAAQCDLASADAKRVHAAKETSSERMYLTALLVQCGLFDDAAEVATSGADEPAPVRAVLLLDTRVQALAHAGRWDEARELAKQAFARASSIQTPAGEQELLFDDRANVVTATSYLLMALSLRTGDMSACPSIALPKNADQAEVTWKDLIAKPEPERIKLRWHMRSFDGPFHSAARPAELFVVGKAVDSGVEVWLDAELNAIFQPFKRGTVNMRARAEAARWRGDAKTESEWLARATAVEKLLTSPKKVVLARVAGF